MTALQPTHKSFPVPYAPPAAPAPAKYFEHLSDARAFVVRAHGRAARALEAAEVDITRVEPSRVTGSIHQANQALFTLAAAERYRVRHADMIPTAARDQAMAAAGQIEKGTQSLRRAEVMVSDPALMQDPPALAIAIDSLRAGVDDLTAGIEHLEQAASLEPLVDPLPST